MPTVLVTGASAGIGLEITRQLAVRGARVLLHGRAPDRVERAVDEVRRAAPDAAVEPLLANLARFADVRRLADDVAGRGELDALMNNAGVWDRSGARRLTPDGHEQTWQVNHLAPFLLTALLLDVLARDPPGRVVNLSSGAHRRGRLNWEDPDAHTGGEAYAQSKLALTMAAVELAARAGDRGIVANAVDPGWIATAMGGGGAPGSVQEGADTPVWLALEADAELTGRYLRARRPAEAHPLVGDAEARRRLWELSARQCGLAE